MTSDYHGCTNVLDWEENVPVSDISPLCLPVELHTCSYSHLKIVYID